uniref:Uncharacterized protein n=1 Tax=viral metagenome TaxID=1070528 RepID=A0A6M3KEL9_9ZZZZ
MNLSTLTNEIADWLQQDLSGTNVVWTEAKIQAAIRQGMREFSSFLLRDSLSSDIEYTTSEINLPANFISAFRVSIDGTTVPIIDIQKLDLSGITDPFTSTGDVEAVIDLHNTTNVRVLRLVPQADDLTKTIDLWYKAQTGEPTNDDDLIELNDWLIPWLKFKTLAILFAQDSAGKDTKKVELFVTLAEVLQKAFVSLFPTGSVVQ